MSEGDSSLVPSGASQNALRPSWDIPGSAFKTMELLQGLIKASSQDNIHPQAILAAEALGAGILISPERIKDALEALGANKSFRLEQTRISIGLMYGNTQRAIQSSTSLVQFFTFSAAFRLIYIDEEIGDILYEMMFKSGLLSKHPVSPSQLTRLTNQVSGHSELCVPMDLMHSIASSIAKYNPDSAVYVRLDQKVLAQILMNVFENMRDESADSLCLTGSKSATWIATAFLWWLQDDACLVVNQELVYGKASARLSITLLPQSASEQPWELEVWKKSEDPVSFLFKEEMANTGDTLPKRLPLNCMKGYFETYNWSQWSAEDSQRLREFAQETTAELASAIILAIIEMGTIISNSFGLRTQFSTIADASWLARSTTLIEEYGWESSPDSAKLCKELINYLSLVLHGTEESSSSRKIYSPDEIQRRLEDFCIQHIEQKTDLDYGDPFVVMEPVYSIVIDAILTCTTHAEPGARYGKPFTPEDMGEPWSCIYSLLSNGLRIEDFRTLAFRQLLGTKTSSGTSHLMRFANGIVAAMSVPWTRMCDPREACAIRLVRGAIKYDGIDFTDVRQDSETLRSSFGEQNLIHPVKFSHVDRQGKRFILHEPSPFQDSYCIDTYVAVSGSSLHVKQYMLRSKPAILRPAVKCPVSWINAIDSAILATHFRDALPINSKAVCELHSAAEICLRERKICWLSPTSRIDMLDNDLIVIDSKGDETIKMFTAARYTLWLQHKWKVFVHHKGQFLDSLCKACQEKPSILII